MGIMLHLTREKSFARVELYAVIICAFRRNLGLLPKVKIVMVLSITSASEFIGLIWQQVIQRSLGGRS